MTQTQCYDPTKQYYLDRLEIVNAKAYLYYIENSYNLSDYELKSNLWSSDIWHEAKCIFKLLNEHLYGKLTCEHCNTGFNYPYVKSFQLHHINHEYIWDQLFNPDKILLVHKHCHKEIHDINREAKQ